MSDLTLNTKKLAEIYKEWRGNESCYDDGRPVFNSSELLDFAEFCLTHEANEVTRPHEKALPMCVMPSAFEKLTDKELEEENRLLKLIIENGLGAEDLENDCL